MARFVALTAMRDRVITLCDLPATLDTTTPVTAAAMLDLLQTSAALLSALVSEFAPFHFAASAELSTTAGVEIVSLPTEASSLLRVSWLKDASTEILLHPASIDAMQAGSAGWDAAVPVTYRIVGQTIELFPTPAATHTLKIYYNTGLYPADIDATAWCMDTWDQYIVLQTCVLVRSRQQKACPEFTAPLQMLAKSITAQLKRDQNGIHVARDLRTAQPQLSGLDYRLWGR